MPNNIEGRSYLITLLIHKIITIITMIMTKYAPLYSCLSKETNNCLSSERNQESNCHKGLRQLKPTIQFSQQDPVFLSIQKITQTRKLIKTTPSEKSNWLFSDVKLGSKKIQIFFNFLVLLFFPVIIFIINFYQ